MKVLLIQPPIRDFYDTGIRVQPLGLCMLKAAAGKHVPHVEVLVKDYHQGQGKRSIPLPPELSYLKEYYPYPDTSPFCTFHHYYHFGASFEEIAREVERERPDLVGISSLFSPYHGEALACAGEIKRRLHVPILLGGAHVSASPLTVMQSPQVDFIIRGEGERPFVEFLKAFGSQQSLDEVPNLGFKRGQEAVLNSLEDNFPLEDLPLPDLSDLRKGRYLFEGRPLCFLTTTRGCPHRCSFCSVHLTFREGFRSRSSGNILGEMRQRYAEGYRVFDFEDDNLTYDRERFMEILTCLGEEHLPGELRLMAMNGISYLSLDGEMLTLMKETGFTHLNISLVSADRVVLSKVRRPHTIEKYLEVVGQAHALGFHITSYQILGIPGETLGTMVETMGLMARLPVRIGASIFYLTPGCPMASGLPDITERDMVRSRSTGMAVETDLFSRDDLYTLFITARIINYLKGLPVRGSVVSLREALHSAAETGKRAGTGGEILSRLLEEKELFAATKEGMKPLSHFKPNLFFGVLQQSGGIRTREGALITLR